MSIAINSMGPVGLATGFVVCWMVVDEVIRNPLFYCCP